MDFFFLTYLVTSHFNFIHEQIFSFFADLRWFLRVYCLYLDYLLRPVFLHVLPHITTQSSIV